MSGPPSACAYAFWRLVVRAPFMMELWREHSSIFAYKLVAHIPPMQTLSPWPLAFQSYSMALKARKVTWWRPPSLLSPTLARPLSTLSRPLSPAVLSPHCRAGAGCTSHTHRLFRFIQSRFHEERLAWKTFIWSK